MGLKRDINYVPHVRRNAGIASPEQIELVNRTSAPSDSNLADGRIYYHSTDDAYYGYANSLWFPLGGVTKVNSVTTTTTLTTSQSGQVFVCTSVGGSLYVKLPAPTTSGIVYHISNNSPNAATGDLHVVSAADAGADNAYWIGGVRSTFVALRIRGRSVSLVSDGSSTWVSIASNL